MHNLLNRGIAALTNRNDIILAVMIVAIIFMMILPLPTLAVDALIGVNMTISATLLMVAMYLPSPLAFSSFPSVLLVTTLFRLGISIATTRLILLQGDAGHIIETFGNFVVGGNLIVGLVVFLILTIVQFVVITGRRARGRSRGALLAGRHARQADVDRRRPARGHHRHGPGPPAPFRGREGKPALRRHGRRDEVREGRRHRRPHHRGRQPAGRYSHRHAATRHDGRQRGAGVFDPDHRRRPDRADPRAVHRHLRRHHRDARADRRRTVQRRSGHRLPGAGATARAGHRRRHRPGHGSDPRHADPGFRDTGAGGGDGGPGAAALHPQGGGREDRRDHRDLVPGPGRPEARKPRRTAAPSSRPRCRSCWTWRPDCSAASTRRRSTPSS